MDYGWHNVTYAIYIKSEEDAIRTVKDFGYESLQHSYNNGFIFWTDWFQDEDEYFSYFENGKAYDLNEWDDYKNLKTVVIHPSDPTTMFLRPVYERKGWDLINQFIKEEDLSVLIESYDRVVCMGHGTPGGLLSKYGMIFTSSHVPIIQDKKFISIWCNSDMFVQHHQLDPSLFTGMIISEVIEAKAYSLPTDEDLVDESNELFESALEQIHRVPLSRRTH